MCSFACHICIFFFYILTDGGFWKRVAQSSCTHGASSNLGGYQRGDADTNTIYRKTGHVLQRGYSNYQGYLFSFFCLLLLFMGVLRSRVLIHFVFVILCALCCYHNFCRDYCKQSLMNSKIFFLACKLNLI